MINELRPIRPQRGRASFLTTLFLFCCVLIAGFTIVGYAVGWVTISQDRQQQKTTIEVETGKVKEAAEEAVDKSQELLQRAGDKIQDMRKGNTDAGSPPTDGLLHKQPAGENSSKEQQPSD